MRLWRINLKPKSQQGISTSEFCFSNHIVGIGWQVDPVPKTKEEYFQYGKQKYKVGRGWSAAANAFLNRMKEGDLIWSRNRQGNYYLGSIDSDWRYESGAAFTNADIPNVRSCKWVEVGLMDSVPGSVINGFRPAATVQRIKDKSAALYSQFLYGKLSGLPFSRPMKVTETDILRLLSDEDLEDAVAIYLQVAERCVMFPSTCKKDTMAVECLFVSLDSGEKIGLQVKSGNYRLNLDEYASFKGKMYLFTASGNYLGQTQPNCTCLAPETLRSFVLQNKRLMPTRVQNWINYVETSQSSSI